MNVKSKATHRQELDRHFGRPEARKLVWGVVAERRRILTEVVPTLAGPRLWLECQNHCGTSSLKQVAVVRRLPASTQPRSATGAAPTLDQDRAELSRQWKEESFDECRMIWILQCALAQAARSGLLLIRRVHANQISICMMRETHESSLATLL
jgi:hypothetical protein